MADEKKSESLEFNFEDFEAQIDSEIDTLFAPAVSPSFEIAEGGASAVVPAEEKAPEDFEKDLQDFEKDLPSAVQFEEMPAQQVQSGVENTPFDLGAIEAQIDSEIDALFVPFEQAGPVTEDIPVEWEPEVASAHEGVVPKELKPESQPEPMFVMEPVVELEAGRQPGQPPADTVPEEMPEGMDGAAARSVEVAELLESLSVAYLSLDWDLSAENVSRFGATLEKLTPYCGKVPEAGAILEMFKTVLTDLRSRPMSVTRRHIGFVRDAEILLRALLLSETPPGTYEKEQLESLDERLQSILEEQVPDGATPERKGFDAPPPPFQPPPPSGDDGKREAAMIPLEDAGTFDWQPLWSLREWMETYRRRSDEALHRITLETRRLSKLEATLSKTPALAALTARIGKIRSNLEAGASSLRGMAEEWNPRLQWLDQFEKELESHVRTQSDLDSDASRVVEEETGNVRQDESPSPPEALEPCVPKAAVPKLVQEEVCLFEIHGKRMAVHGCHVVKMDRVSPRKMRRIIQRGYATLRDFKPFLRSIKAGVTGGWRDQQIDLLDSMRFIPLTNEMLRLPGLPLHSGRVLFLSDGSHHGVVVVSPSQPNQFIRAEIVVGEMQLKGVFGIIHAAGGSTIEVMDLGGMLSGPTDREIPT